MRGRDDRQSDSAKPILPWRLVAGAFLHFGLLAYLICVPLACLLTAPAGASADRIVRLALAYSARFVLGLGALAIVATVAAALLDPLLRSRRRRRAARDPLAPVRAARRALDEASALAQGALDAAAATQVTALVGARWDCDDARFQALARDLAEVVRTSAAAARSAPPERHGAISARARASLDHIAQEFGELNAERAKYDEAEAATTARYVEMRYGNADFAIRGD